MSKPRKGGENSHHKSNKQERRLERSSKHRKAEVLRLAHLREAKAPQFK
jgi:hypothetical protein